MKTAKAPRPRRHRGPYANSAQMTEEQRIALQGALKDVRVRVHGLYPQGEPSAKGRPTTLRNQLLVMDPGVHPADETAAASALDTQRITERTVNLLYALRLVASGRLFGQAAKLLLSK